MRQRNYSYITLFFCFVLFLSTAALADPVELGKVRTAIRQKGAKWTAGETSISRLKPEARTALLMRKPLRVVAPHKPVPRPLPLPASFDWRNVSGSNYITPIRLQVGGTCVAYANTAAVESLVLRMLPIQGIDIDLSEHALTSCNSGYPANCHTFLINTGLPTETCYPFNATSGECSTACAGWQNKTYKVVRQDYYVWPMIDEVKALIFQMGPVVTGMNVPPDFFYYSDGIYSDIAEAIAITKEEVTVENCVAAAKKGGYVYAGLQDGNQCFAGNTLGYNKVPESECNMPCAANNAQMCGGAWRNSIFSTNPSVYQGCYTDGDKRALPIILNADDGFHEVLIVGYDDNQQCFIGKNSWGTGWGEQGFFRIAYSEFESRVVGFGTLNAIYTGIIGPNVPVMKVMPAKIDFGAQAGTPKNVSVVNIGGVPLTISSIAIQGTNSGAFTLSGNNCAQGQVQKFQKCTVSVTFNSPSGGCKTAQLIVSSNDPDQPKTTVELRGHSANTAECAGKCVNLNTDSYNCGDCGLRCRSGSTCVKGKCVCPSGMKSCCGGDICIQSNKKCPVCP